MVKLIHQIRKWRHAARWSVVIGVAFVSTVNAVILPAIPQPQSYHHFADTRIFLGSPNALDVLSNLPFILVGILGVYFGLHLQSTLTNSQRLAYGAMFAGLILTGLGSGYYHLAPDNQRLVWDRLPMIIGMAGFISALLTYRFRPS